MQIIRSTVIGMTNDGVGRASQTLRRTLSNTCCSFPRMSTTRLLPGGRYNGFTYSDCWTAARGWPFPFSFFLRCLSPFLVRFRTDVPVALMSHKGVTG